MLWGQLCDLPLGDATTRVVTMTQIPLVLEPPGLSPPKKHVRDTSRAAYAEGLERFRGRKADVLRWLTVYWNNFREWPTSAELAHCGKVLDTSSGFEGPDNRQVWILQTRRGLSDLQAVGVVESAGKRRCQVTGRECHVWRVASR